MEHLGEYLSTRDFTIDISKTIRPSEASVDIEPETLVFISDNNNSNGIAYLIVGYPTSVSFGVYSFNCGENRNYNKTAKPQVPHSTKLANIVAECIDESLCLNIDITTTLSNTNINIQRRLLNNNDELYKICIGFDNNNNILISVPGGILTAPSIAKITKGGILMELAENENMIECNIGELDAYKMNCTVSEFNSVFDIVQMNNNKNGLGIFYGINFIDAYCGPWVYITKRKGKIKTPVLERENNTPANENNNGHIVFIFNF